MRMKKKKKKKARILCIFLKLVFTAFYKPEVLDFSGHENEKEEKNG